MPIEDVFSITGRGTVATGRIESGEVRVDDEVEIVGIRRESLKSVVTGVEMFRLFRREMLRKSVHLLVAAEGHIRKILDRGDAGDNVGLLLRGIEKD